jgi:hypothetical protein
MLRAPIKIQGPMAILVSMVIVNLDYLSHALRAPVDQDGRTRIAGRPPSRCHWA